MPTNLRTTFAFVHPIWGVFVKKAYFLAQETHHVGMTTLAVRDTSPVTENPWERLSRLVERRRKILGLTLAGVQAVGGPSPRWVQKMRENEGAPTDRMRRPLRMLDLALRWPEDTSWNLVALDRTGWVDEVLEDEEEQLMESVDEADELAYVVAHRIRAIPRGPLRDEAMRRVLAALDVTP